MDTKVNNAGASASELRPIVSMELRALAKRIDLALPKTTDPLTRSHLFASRKDIENILNNKYSSPTQGRGMDSGIIYLGGIGKPSADGCWTSRTSDLRKALRKN